MKSLDQLFDYYSKRHYEFQMGWGIVGQVSALITFETFAMILCTKFGITGSPAIFLYVGVPIVAVIGVTYMGHKMIKSGYAHKYQKFGADVNKDWKETVLKVDKMSECMAQLIAELKETTQIVEKKE